MYELIKFLMEKMNTNTENLRKKMSPESSVIIQQMVAQDTAYGDLKEKLQQMQKNHEKLQQNMVEVQMQRESISGQYQKELRLRADTLNKLGSTFEICNVLEKSSERLKDTLSRCKADQIALYESYQHSRQLVRDMISEQVQASENNRVVVTGLKEKVKLMTDHQNQMLQHFTTAKQQVDSEVADLRNKLKSITAHKDESIIVQNELISKLGLYKIEMEKKEEINADLNTELKKLIQEFKNQASEGRDVLENQKREINEITEENNSLKKALNNQEQFTNTVFEQNKKFQEKIAFLEDKHRGLRNTIDELQLQVQEAENTKQRLQNNITALIEEKKKLLVEIQNIKKMSNNLELKMNALKTEYEQLEMEKINVIDKLNDALEASNNTAIEIEKFVDIKVKLEEKFAQLEDVSKTNSRVTEERIKDFTAEIEALDKEINYKVCNIMGLTSDLKKNTGAISKLNVALQKIKKDSDMEKDITKEKEKKMSDAILHLETNIKEKDNELSEQMGIIMELRNEKERAQEQIQNLQNKFASVQEALMNPAPSEGRGLHESAVTTRLRNEMQSIQPSTRISPRPADFGIPHAQNADNYDTLMMFSEGSVEGDSLKLSEVNRRFNAVAGGRRQEEHVPTSPFAAFRQRRALSPILHTFNTPPVQRPRPEPTNNESFKSITQTTFNSKNKERKFFKNKRSSNRPN